MSSEEILLLILFHASVIPTLSMPLSNFQHHSPLKAGLVNTNKEIDHSTSLPRYLKVPTLVQTFEGADVILSCNIENLADRMVFWIRNSDLQILTAGLLTFSSDKRFSVNHENSIDENDWSLLITNVRTHDSGAYECQINTDPKMKLNINLLVKESEEMMEMDSPFHQGASIEGEHSKVLKRGHTVTLTCRVFGIVYDNSSQKRIEWMKNGELLSLKTRNEGAVTTIDTIWSEKDGISRLTLAMLKDGDEGSYSCSSNGFSSEVVELRILPENMSLTSYLGNIPTNMGKDERMEKNFAQISTACRCFSVTKMFYLNLLLLLIFNQILL